MCNLCLAPAGSTFACFSCAANRMRLWRATNRSNLTQLRPNGLFSNEFRNSRTIYPFLSQQQSFKTFGTFSSRFSRILSWFRRDDQKSRDPSLHRELNEKEGVFKSAEQKAVPHFEKFWTKEKCEEAKQQHRAVSGRICQYPLSTVRCYYKNFLNDVLTFITLVYSMLCRLLSALLKRVLQWQKFEYQVG